MMRVEIKRFARRVCLVLLLISTSTKNTSHAAVIVRPEQEVYYVMPGETFELRIHIDANDQTLGNSFEPLANGLFSYGVTVSYPAGLASVSSVSAITPVAQLDYFGFSPGAQKQVTTNSASAKGNIDVEEGLPYVGSLLLTIQVTNFVPAPSAYWLNLDEWRTLGASEQIFIDGGGGLLDTTPSVNLFLPALVVVVPEPSGFVMLLEFVLCAVGVRRGYRTLNRD